MHIPIPRRKKPLLILAGTVLAVALLCAGGWWFATWRGTVDYRSQAQSFNTKTAKALSDAITPFKDITKDGDLQKGVDALGTFGAAVQTQLNAQPKMPLLFGIALAPSADQHAHDELTTRLQQLKKNADSAVAFMRYEQSVYAILQEPTTKTGADAAQQKALAEAWAAMGAKLKAITPPAEVNDVHGKIIAAVASVQAALAALPDLYNKKDIAGFDAKQKEADAHVSELRAYGAAIGVLAKNHDQALAGSLQNVREATR